MERGLNEDRKDLTKWVNEEEWISVCSWLYESNIEDKMKGVSRVAAWRARGEVPFPIESTVDIVECLINEEIQKQSNETQQSLCLMFSMTITRFINGVYDYGLLSTSRGAIYDIVKEFGIPFWLVELRHDSTHRVLPSLSLLKEGAWFCYRWLWTNYWQLKLQLSQAKVKNKQCDQLSFPINEQETTPLLGDQVSDESLIKIVNIFRNAPKSLKLNMFKPFSIVTFNDFVILLKEHSFLYPTNSIDFELTNVPDKSDLSSMPILNSSLYLYWSPFLKRIGRYHSSIKTILITAIVTVMHSSSTACKWSMLLAGWLGALLSTYTVDDGELMKGEVVWGRIVDVLKSNPGYYSYPLMEICLNQLIMDSNAIHDILHLTKLVTISQRSGYYCVPLSLSAVTAYETEYDKEFVEMKLKIQDEPRMDTNLQHGNEDQFRNQWKKASGVDWYSVPVGTVLSKGHVFTPTMLDLDNAQVNTLDHTTNGQVPLNHTEPAISEQDMDTDCNALDDTINCDRLTREQLEIIQQAIVLY